jgi:hypothetical protein
MTTASEDLHARPAAREEIGQGRAGVVKNLARWVELEQGKMRMINVEFSVDEVDEAEGRASDV